MPEVAREKIFRARKKLKYLYYILRITLNVFRDTLKKGNFWHIQRSNNLYNIQYIMVEKYTQNLFGFDLNN